MVKKLGFGLENLVIKKSTRRLLFIGSHCSSALGHGSGTARKRALLRLGNGHCRFGIGSGVAREWVHRLGHGCSRTTWSLPRSLLEQAAEKCGRDLSLPGHGRAGISSNTWRASGVAEDFGRCRGVIGVCRWLSGVARSGISSSTWCARLSGPG